MYVSAVRVYSGLESENVGPESKVNVSVEDFSGLDDTETGLG